jgi:hypothetical protein
VDGAGRGRRGVDGPVLPVRERVRDVPGEGGRDGGGRGQQRPRPGPRRPVAGGCPPWTLAWTDESPGGEGIRTWSSPVCLDL